MVVGDTAAIVGYREKIKKKKKREEKTFGRSDGRVGWRQSKPMSRRSVI